jgi:Sulfotransferase family
MTSTTARSTPGSPPASASFSAGDAPAAAALREAEGQLLEAVLADTNPARAPAVFILGSPRTGSTRLYQAMAQFLRLPYIPNLANDVFPDHPALVAPLLRQVFPGLDIPFVARYGKTRGAFQPSEASAVMRGWFGGDHPSETASARVLPGRADQLTRTVAAYRAVFGAPVMIKNAWNCFRIASLADLLPNARFIWIRRDITASALSDLASRYAVRGDPAAWNSATPANVESLRRLPYWAQVVENQFEFARAIRDGLTAHAPGRHTVLWFEDLVRDPAGTFAQLTTDLKGLLPSAPPADLSLGAGERTEKPFRAGDEANLRAYVEEHRDRLADCWYRAGGSA